MVAHSIVNNSGQTLDTEFVLKVLQGTCDLQRIHQAVIVNLTHDDEMRALNSKFRNVSETTDVLTFPSGMGLPFPQGDIAISVPYAQSQADLRGVSLENEIAALVIHGVLHLVGYDDEEDDDKKRMQDAMKKVAQELAIPIDAEWTSILHQEKA
jgi:probable rRNA maturation factor